MYLLEGFPTRLFVWRMIRYIIKLSEIDGLTRSLFCIEAVRRRRDDTMGDCFILLKYHRTISLACKTFYLFCIMR